ncbi:MAG TPA: tyrosine-protein phosphatase, partial [Mycobacterium sp.]|nr:tyrosine-protein phosphatase [Mycobacterium sp.]
IRNRMSETPEVAEVAEARLTDAVLGVQEAYLDSAHGAIIEDFGSLDGYLDAAGLTRDDVVKLRAALRG